MYLLKALAEYICQGVNTSLEGLLIPSMLKRYMWTIDSTYLLVTIA